MHQKTSRAGSPRTGIPKPMISLANLELRTFVLLNTAFSRLGWSRAWQRASSRFVFDSKRLARAASSEKKLFQIVGVARSGTTLLCRSVDLHPDLVCFNEPFSDFYRHNGFSRFADRSRFHSVPASALERLAKDSPGALVGFKETFRDRAGVGHALVSKDFVESNERLGACKTIAVLRDPRDVWCSLLDNNARLGSPRIPLTRNFTNTWTGMARWARSRDLFVVRYEDLVTDHEAEIRRVVDHLGVGFDPRMLDRSADLNDATAGDVPVSGDPVALSTKPVDNASVSRFQEDLDPLERDFIEAECAALMREFGYPL